MVWVGMTLEKTDFPSISSHVPRKHDGGSSSRRRSRRKLLYRVLVVVVLVVEP